MHLCTCVSEEGGDGEGAGSEVPSPLSYTDTAPGGPSESPPLITSLQALQPNNIRRQKEKEKKGVG
jgi:hypothetical protein